MPPTLVIHASQYMNHKPFLKIVRYCLEVYCLEVYCLLPFVVIWANMAFSQSAYVVLAQLCLGTYLNRLSNIVHRR